MARRYSSTDTSDLQFLSWVHILIFWLISWKESTQRNTEASSAGVKSAPSGSDLAANTTPGFGNLPQTWSDLVHERRELGCLLRLLLCNCVKRAHPSRTSLIFLFDHLGADSVEYGCRSYLAQIKERAQVSPAADSGKRSRCSGGLVLHKQQRSHRCC